MPHVRPARLRSRLAAAALAGAAAVTTAVVAAPPAQAFFTCGSSGDFCIMTIDRQHLIPPCVCELTVNWSLDDRAVMARLDDLVNQGAFNYRTAGRTADPALKARLQAVGYDQLTQAVRTASVAPWLKPQPQPWLQAAGTDLVTGLQTAFQAERTRDPATAAALRARASAAFQSFGSR